MPTRITKDEIKLVSKLYLNNPELSFDDIAKKINRTKGSIFRIINKNKLSEKIDKNVKRERTKNAKTKTIIKSYTGSKCIKCGIILDKQNHSRLSLIEFQVGPKEQRRWRICKNCLKDYKKKSRNPKKDKITHDIWKIKNWEKVLLKGCQRRARDYGFLCDLTSNDILDQFKLQNGRCYWFGNTLKISNQKKFLSKPSIDKLNTNGNYTKRNIVISSYFANIARQNTEVTLWKNTVKKIKNSLKNEK